MFIGHYGVALAAKKCAPKTNLGILIIAASLLDLLWPILLILGLETVRIAPGDTVVTPLEFISYPYSHSLVMSLAYGALFGYAYFRITAYRTGGIAVFALVVSHWVLDFISHRADMPLLPWNGWKVGLGLWNSLPATLLVEGALFAAGVWLYTKTAAPTGKMGIISLWSFVLFCVASYFGNLFGPPPPSETALMWFAPLAWLFPLWGLWIERTRSVK
ncbi:MAG: hypothetical protein HZA04_01315 [Nitrospinae bacterium]|nr:hypothetical protein [Nitrospinota bacterium]